MYCQVYGSLRVFTAITDTRRLDRYRSADRYERGCGLLYSCVVIESERLPCYPDMNCYCKYLETSPLKAHYGTRSRFICGWYVLCSLFSCVCTIVLTGSHCSSDVNAT